MLTLLRARPLKKPICLLLSLCFLNNFLNCHCYLCITIMGDNIEEVSEVEGCMPLHPEEVTTISPKTKNKNGKVSNHNDVFNPVNITI